MDETDRLLERVRREAHGKLGPAAYRRLYESAAAIGGGTIVEIGTSQGAATIAMALGAKAAGLDFRIVTLDAHFIGTRPRGSSESEKKAIVRRGFEAFGVSGRIDMVIGKVEALVATADPEDISMLLIDADGRIDRDLAALWQRLRPGCAIVIDDTDDQVYAHRRGRRLLIDQKHRITHRLIAALVEAGLLVPGGAVGQTSWFRKGEAPGGAQEIERLALPAYRDLVFVEIGAGTLSVKRALYGLAASRTPWLVQAWHGFRKR
ncbi:MAG TPA: class I SAM-dependent methyltransferase [Allosphingosinicella sp.]